MFCFKHVYTIGWSGVMALVYSFHFIANEWRRVFVYFDSRSQCIEGSCLNIQRIPSYWPYICSAQSRNRSNSKIKWLKVNLMWPDFGSKSWPLSNNR